MNAIEDTILLEDVRRIRKYEALKGHNITTISDNRPWLILTSTMFHTLIATPLLFVQFGIIITPFAPNPYFIPTALSLLIISCITQIVIVGFVIRTDGDAICIYRLFSRQVIPIEKSHIEVGFSFFWRWHSIYIYYLKHKVKITKGYSFNIRQGTGFFIDLISHRKKVGKFKKLKKGK